MIQARRLCSAVLLSFVAVSVVYLVIDASQRSGDSRPADTPAAAAHAALQPAGPAAVTNSVPPASGSMAGGDAPAPTEIQPKLTAYYFHRTQRCRTCLAMEAYAEQALREDFPEQFEAGSVDWQTINVELQENEHYIQDYQITGSALVMVCRQPGGTIEWENLDRIWDLVGDEGSFKKYVVEQAHSMMERDS